MNTIEIKTFSEYKRNGIDLTKGNTMKTLTLLFGCLLLTAAVYANDTHLNPDQVPSIGLDYNRYVATGVLAVVPDTLPNGTAVTRVDFTGIGQTNMTADLRIPLNNYFTMDVHGGPSWMNYQGVGISGWQGGASVRLYLHPGIFKNLGR